MSDEASRRPSNEGPAPSFGIPREANPTLTLRRQVMFSSKALKTVAFAATLALAAPALAATVIVGGQPMFPNKTIVQNAVNSADHTTLVAAVKAAGLVDTLQGPGPFTVFAPVNSAFAALPAGTVDELLKPENKTMLVKVLTYHVVPGTITFNDLKTKVKKGGGMATLKTVSG